MPNGGWQGMRDAELVAKAQKGDLEAFDRLVLRHRARLFQIARDIAREPEAAQDIVQDALLRAYQAMNALHDAERFGPWMNTIVRRVAQGWVRDGRRREQAVNTGSVTGVFTGGWVAAAPPTEARHRIGDALAVLTQREHRVMVLHYLEGLTCEEIATQLHVSAGTVKSILHYSRRKVRKECDEMAEAEKERKGPREWVLWRDGEVANDPRWRTLVYGLGTLSSSVGLAVNKRAKTLRQISAEVEVPTQYLAEIAEQLVGMELLTSPRKGQYLLNFIALDAEHWRKLVARVSQPGAKAATMLAAGEDKLRRAFAKTPVARAGWKWKNVAWAVQGCLLAHRTAIRALAPESVAPPPPRYGGGRFWVGARERLPGLREPWTLSGSGRWLDDLLLGYFNTSGDQGHSDWMFGSPAAPLDLLQRLVTKPLTEKELLGKLGGKAEQWRAALAKAVSAGVVRKTNGRYGFAVPVFRQEDSDILSPVLLEIARPVVAEVISPIWGGVDKLLDEMGYGHCQDQYPAWRRWMAARVMGEALRFLMEQGVLPRLDDDVRDSATFVVWNARLPEAESAP